jgi:hypothetical protein
MTMNKKDVIDWILELESLDTLSAIRRKINNRINSIKSEKDNYNPLKNIPIEKKYEIIKELFEEKTEGKE